MTRNDEPWFLVESKKGDGSVNPALHYFQKRTGARHAFQVVIDLPYADTDLLPVKPPFKVPALTFLSQLL